MLSCVASRYLRQGIRQISAASRRPRPDPLIVTDRAAKHIQSLLTRKRSGDENIVGIRIGVIRRGCNGQAYTMNYATQVSPTDEVIQKKDVKILVDGKALMFLIGTTMDWVEDDLRAEFVFQNPNAKALCGCGESFTT